MGLHKAALNYDPDLGVKFTTFAVYHVVGAIKAELRENRLIRMNRKLFRSSPRSGLIRPHLPMRSRCGWT